MKLAVFNGSPRGKKSNSDILLRHFLFGFNHTPGHIVTKSYLYKLKENGRHLQEFQDSDFILLAFPLYTDAMPGIVKHFIESLSKIETRDKKMGFIVQSGFPEAFHSTFIARYLEKLVLRLGAENLGVVIKGGVEGIQVKPPLMNKKLLRSFHELGRIFGQTGEFDQRIIEKLKKPMHLPKSMLLLAPLLKRTGLLDLYWTAQLKQNKVYKKRYDRPYE